jgi:prepilin-type N-terminal cleavage/methylation domain-containing protein
MRIDTHFSRSRSTGFSLMEILVVISIILVLAAIAFPVYSTVKMRSNKAVAINNMRQIGAALAVYAGQNDGDFPDEDAKGVDSWMNAAKPESGKAWYNALPRLLNRRGVGDYASIPRDFYTKDNLLFLPGAQYPESDKRLVHPIFAIAINTKLQRKGADHMKAKAKMSQVTQPARTVAFLESGIYGEVKATATQPRYSGSCKGSAKAFVARYGGTGVLTFVDGHAETVQGKDILTETGRIPYPQTNIVWTRSPDEDPN